MMSKNRLGWFVRISSAAILSMSVAACSDDAGTGDPDPDAGEECDPNGHDGCNELAVAALPENGKLHIEYVQVGIDPATGDRVEAPQRAFMVMFDGQDDWDTSTERTDPRPYLGADVFQTDTMHCYDQTTNNTFVQAYHPIVQALADSRNYYADGPDSIELTTDGGGALTMNKVQGEFDPANHITHGQMYIADPQALPTNLMRADYHNLPVVAPNGDFPGLDLGTAYDVPGQLAEYSGAGVYLPPDYNYTTPAPDVYFQHPFYIDPSQNLTMTYEMENAATLDANAPTTMFLAGFARMEDYGDGAGMQPTVTYICAGLAPAGQNSHTVEIPAEVFTANGFVPNGLMITGLFTHIVHEHSLADGDYRFDKIGMNCEFTQYTTEAPAP